MELPEDINLTRALTAESVSRGYMLRSQTTRNVLYGSAALAFAIGVSIAAIVYANNQKLDMEALKQVLAQMPELKVATIPALTLEPPAPLKLEEGTVRIAEGGVVAIHPNATVHVEGTAAQPPVQLPTAELRKTDGGDAIRREVTVFNTVAFGKGQVVTGWRYANGTGKTPTGQYCYFSQATSDGTERKIDIATNRVPDTAGRKLVPNFDAAMTRCVWL